MPEGDQVCRECKGETWSMPSEDLSITADKLGILLVCSVRYAMGTRSYMPTVVTGAVNGFLKQLNVENLRTILRDIREADSLGDKHIDEPLWLDLADRIDGELAGREAT